MKDTAKTSEPMLNVPPVTLGLTALLVAIFILCRILPSHAEEYLGRLVFIPGEFYWQNAYTLFTYGLLHFSWPHILMNGFGMLAFGSAVERLLGMKYYLVIFMGGVIIGALGHWALFPHSGNPLGGASAGVSALFGALLPFLVRRPQLLTTNIIFILTNVALGLIGVPPEPGQEQTMAIAWQAHIFGFAFGQIVGTVIIRKKISRLKKRDIDKLKDQQV